MTQTAGPQRREVLYRGTVQGVGFRYTARRTAAAYGVTGYVRNRSDGRVHLAVEGDAAEIDRFLADLQRRMGHNIEGVEETTGPASGEFDRFEIRP